MPQSTSRVRRLRLVPAFLLAGLLAASPASAQSDRYDDPPWNGLATGAALGAITGVVGAGAVYGDCRYCNVPDTWHVYAMYGAAGAGGGAAVGWLVDKMHKGRRPPTSRLNARLIPASLTSEAPIVRSHVDSSWDGFAKGALIGAGTMTAFIAFNYAQCDAGCEAPAPGSMYLWGLAVGAGGGGAIGWVVDRLHVPREAVPTVAIRADREARAVRLQWRF
jgi:hypothetical protein